MTNWKGVEMRQSLQGFDRISVGEVPFACATMDDAVEHLLVEAGSRPRNSGGTSVRLSNAYCVALANSDDKYGRLLRESGVNFPDGTPVGVILKRRAAKNGAAADVVRGPTFFARALEQSQGTGIRHFLLGTTDETLLALRREIEARYPGAIICGTHAPGVVSLSEDFYSSAADIVKAGDPHIVWVALGTPKQDFVTTELSTRTGLCCVGVGAAFDFIAGSVKEAPAVLHNTGFEWIYRLLKEPRRLWRRYLFGNVGFLFAVAREAARKDV
jgi:N-acetylglucosaminyldiphosphoundecaprenol N-acetyl-beta-D-mannosaminyltransferase